MDKRIEGGKGSDVWEETLGAWARDESHEASRKRARAAFEKSFRRRGRPPKKDA